MNDDRLLCKRRQTAAVACSTIAGKTFSIIPKNFLFATRTTKKKNKKPASRIYRFDERVRTEVIEQFRASRSLPVRTKKI